MLAPNAESMTVHSSNAWFLKVEEGVMYMDLMSRLLWGWSVLTDTRNTFAVDLLSNWCGVGFFLVVISTPTQPSHCISKHQMLGVGGILALEISGFSQIVQCTHDNS